MEKPIRDPDKIKYKIHDKYSTNKISLKKILKDPLICDQINDAVYRNNAIVIHTYNFIRLFLLTKYDAGEELPIINKKFIQMAIKSIIIPSKGPKPKNENLQTFNMLSIFYQNTYKNLHCENKLDGSNLSQILGYTAVDMVTNIENNIRMHFTKNLNKLIKATFKEKHNYIISIYEKINNDMYNLYSDNNKSLIKNIDIKLKYLSLSKTSAEKKEISSLLKLKFSTVKELNKINKNNKSIINNIKKELSEHIYLISQDLLNQTKNSDKKYHAWIDFVSHKIFPTVKSSIKHEDNLSMHPQQYLKGMIYMASEIEKMNDLLPPDSKKSPSFQFFPLRINTIPKYIPIDTSSLVDLFIEDEPGKYTKDIEANKDILWDKFFKLDKKVFKHNKYSFNYMILTDGVSVSIQLINNLNIGEEKKKKLNMKKKKQKIMELTKGKPINEAYMIKKNLYASEQEKKHKYDTIQLENKKKQKADFKLLSKEEQKFLIEKNKKEKELNTYTEFPYLDKQSDTEYERFKLSNWAVVDPGKRVLLYIKNAKGDRLRYTNKTHIKKTKRLKYTRTLNNYKNKNDIIKIETELSGYNSKSCNIKKFSNYISMKNKLNNSLLDKYKAPIFRKLKWVGYINKVRAEATVGNLIKDKFGNDVKLCYGDWSPSSQMKHKISTPNMSLKRKIAECIEVLNLDEFRTSMLHYKTEEKCKNLYLLDKKGKFLHMHSILTYKMENERLGCVNRDENSVNNMLKIVNNYILTRTRPDKYTRGNVLSSDKQKVGTPAT